MIYLIIYTLIMWGIFAYLLDKTSNLLRAMKSIKSRIKAIEVAMKVSDVTVINFLIDQIKDDINQNYKRETIKSKYPNHFS